MRILYILSLVTVSITSLQFQPRGFLSSSTTNCASRRLSSKHRFGLQAASDSIANIRESLAVPSDTILQAVDKNPRLTVSDCAAAAGIDLFTARQGLTLLASITGADLEVSRDGDIIYNFNNDFRTKLQQRSLGQQLRSVYQTVFPIFYYLLRISFGIALLSSLAIIFTVIIVSASSGSSDDDNNNNRRSSPSSYVRTTSYSNLFRYMALPDSPLL